MADLPQEVTTPFSATPWSNLGDGTRARRYRHIVLALGTALLAYLLYSVGSAPILQSFRALSWRLLIVILFPAMVLKVFDVFAWRCALPRHQVGFGPLLTALLAGQAVTSITPTGPFGGDATKVWMLRHHVGQRDGVASLIIVETTSTVSQGLFLLLGILVAQRTLLNSTPLLRAMEWVLALEAVGVGCFVALQCGGLAARGHAILARFGFAGGSERGAAAAYVDDALVSFYRREPRRLQRSVAWGFLGWIVGAAEVWLILDLLGTPVPMGTAFVIESFGTGISFATFFLPVQIGVDEGGAVATFVALGLSGAAGLSLSLVRRVREMTWIAIGLLLLMGMPPQPVKLAVQPPAA